MTTFSRSIGRYSGYFPLPVHPPSPTEDLKQDGDESTESSVLMEETWPSTSENCDHVRGKEEWRGQRSVVCVAGGGTLGCGVDDLEELSEKMEDKAGSTLARYILLCRCVGGYTLGQHHAVWG